MLVLKRNISAFFHLDNFSSKVSKLAKIAKKARKLKVTMRKKSSKDFFAVQEFAFFNIQKISKANIRISDRYLLSKISSTVEFNLKKIPPRSRELRT